MMRIILTSIICLLVLGIQAQEITTDRPDQTESPAVLAPKSFQFETGYLVQENGDDLREILLPTTLFRIGFLENFELRVVHENALHKRTGTAESAVQGFNDLQFGFKWQLFEGANENFQLALISHAVLPTGTKPEFSLDNYGVINKIAFGQDLGKDWSYGINLNYDYLDAHSIGYTLAVGYGITSKLGIYVEAFGNKSEDEDYEGFYDAGMTYLLEENIQLDFSFGSGLNTDMNYLSVGLSWLFVNTDEN
ncbi:MAG: transporter [Saprospiraceae bacterium]|nr:transporter [Saprospiraceae bacterium]